MSKRHVVDNLVAGVLTNLILIFLGSWVAMLFLGAAYSTDHRVPAFGYKTTVFIMFALYEVVVLGRLRPLNRRRS